MSNTYMPLYGVFDVATGNLQGLCPVSGAISSISGNPVSISGTPTVGQVLTATLATGWTASGYQWLRDGTNISGATSATYTLVSADSGHVVSVSATGLVYASTGATIAAAGAVAPVITSAPVINAISAGSAVTWTPGTVTGSPTPTVTYSLKKNGTIVSSSATSGSYSSTTAGDIFIVTQSATNSAGSATPVDSASVTVSSSLTPTLNLDFTTALPGQVTFTRTSTSKAIVGGTFTSLTANQPAIESWNSTNHGLRVNAAATNLSPGSNQLTNTTYWSTGSMTNATVATSTTDLGPDGTTFMTNMRETTGNGVHLISQTYSSITAGSPLTFSCFVRRASGTTRKGFGMRIAPQFNNAGAQAFFRTDGSMLYAGFATDTATTNAVARMVDLGGGLYFCSLTANAVAAGTYTASIHSVYEGNTSGCLPNTGYAGSTSEGPALSCVQFSATTGPASYCDNATTAGAAVTAEAAIFNDITWLNTGVGTLVVEHDCFSGPVIGSGANTIIGGQPLNYLTATAKTALAWDGTGSDLVNNGGGTTTGATPTFGSDVRLLSTTATTNFGHIKSIKYYPTRLTVSQCQALTAPASTANASAYRIATRAVLPCHLDAATGTSNSYVSRVPATIRGSRSSLKVDFANWVFPGTANTNSVIIDGCALERVTGVAETVLFKFSGSTSVTLTAGASQVLSDAMLPSQFTGLSQFNDGDVYYIRVYYHVPANGNFIPCSRQGSEANTTFWEYDSGVTSPDQAITATGAITFSGTHIAQVRGLAPVLVGVSVSGDPKSAFILGDSRVEGVSGGGGSFAGYSFIQKACDSLGIPSLAYCLGGSSQVTTAALTLWTPYMAYARILIDEMGTNNGNQLMQFADAWVIAKKTYGVDKVIHTALSPSTNGMTTTSLTASGTTATLTIGTGTLPSVGATVTVGGATPAAYNGTFTVVTSGSGAFTYTCLTAPGATATGTVLWTDAFSTTANQTVARALNSNMEKLWAACATTGQLDANDTVSSAGERDGTNSALWAANGTPFLNTQDGLHRSNSADTAAGVALQPILTALVLT